MMHGDCPGTAALDVSACFQPRFPMHAPALRGDSMSDREISFGRCRDHLVIFLKPAADRRHQAGHRCDHCETGFAIRSG
jgi:hypothetical protein